MRHGPRRRPFPVRTCIVGDPLPLVAIGRAMRKRIRRRMVGELGGTMKFTDRTKTNRRQETEGRAIGIFLRVGKLTKKLGREVNDVRGKDAQNNKQKGLVEIPQCQINQY